MNVQRHAIMMGKDCDCQIQGTTFMAWKAKNFESTGNSFRFKIKIKGIRG